MLGGCVVVGGLLASGSLARCVRVLRRGASLFSLSRRRVKLGPGRLCSPRAVLCVAPSRDLCCCVLLCSLATQEEQEGKATGKESGVLQPVNSGSLGLGLSQDWLKQASPMSVEKDTGASHNSSDRRRQREGVRGTYARVYA